MRFIVTGDAGFIGFHVCRRLLEAGHGVLGLDSLSDYYDVGLKHRRLDLLAAEPGFRHQTMALEDHAGVIAAFSDHRPDMVIHLAAQAGVRHSVDNPGAYINANILGSFSILEACRAFPVRHLLMASTSSAYGANDKFPFEERDRATHPMSLYAATKGSMELMAHAYSHLFEIPVTAFRFFTVYGPWGRPDMAYFLFTRRILAGEPIQIFNHGECWRDFTFIDDLVDSVVALTDFAPPLPGLRPAAAAISGDTLSPVAAYRLVNIGAGRPEKLTVLVDEIEAALGCKAIREDRPLPPGDVVRTFANADLLQTITGSKPSTALREGIPQFVSWYRKHYN